MDAIRSMTAGDEAVVIGMVRDLRVEMTKRFDLLDEREDRQDARIAEIEAKGRVAEAVNEAAKKAATDAAARTQVRWGRTIAIASFVATVTVGGIGLVLRVLGL